MTELPEDVVELRHRLQVSLAERDELLQRQTATNEILGVINASSGDLLPVFDAILERAMRLCEAEFGLLATNDAGQIRTVAARGVPPAFAEFRKNNPPVYGPRTGPGRILAGERVVHIVDLKSEDAYRAGDPNRRAVVDLGGARTVLLVPLLKNKSALGYITIYRKEVRPYSDKQIVLLQSFADQAVIAIENARLFNETKEALERQTATADILKVIASSPDDVQPVFDVIVESAVRLCGARMGRVYRYEGGIIYMVAGHGLSVPGRGKVQQVFPRPATDDTIAGQVMRSGRPYFVTDLECDQSVPELSRQMIEALGTRSQVTVPMLRSGDPIGAITVGWAHPAAYQDRQVTLLNTFADQAVIAIENVRLFNEMREALERQTATSEVLQVISNSISSAAPVFERILESTERLITCDNANIFLAMPDEQLHLAAFRGPDADTVRSPYPRPLAQTVAPAVIAARRQIVYEDVANHPDVSEGLRESARAIARGTFSVAMTPLIWEGNAIGMLSVSRDPAIKFNEKELSLLRTFADQAVIAIQNARLFEEVQARTRDLQESLEYQTATSDVLKVISRSSFDLQPVLDTLVDTAVKLCGALNGTICLREGDGYRHRAASGIHGDWAKFLNEHPPTPGRGSITGRVLLSGRPESIPDVLEDPDYVFPLAAMNKTRSVFGVPLLRHDKVEGVLLLARAEPGLFTQRQIDLVQTFADQAVIAIENARLLTELRQRTDDLTKSLEHLRTAQDRLVQTEKLASLGQLTAGIAHEIKNPLNFVNNFSALSAELIEEMKDLLSEVSLDKNKREDLDEITQMLKSNLDKVVQHGKRADSIVKNMLLHSRQGSGEHRPVDINAIVDEALNLAYHGARAENTAFNITMHRSFDPAVGMADGYPQEITRALLNLISNGFYAATKRKADAGDGFEPTLTATTKNLGDKVEIRIRDNGTGIPTEVKEKIFNPFFTTKPAGEGTGLGLSMSHDIIVKQHGGTIDVDTVPGVLTEFKIVLPRAGASFTSHENIRV